VGRDEFGVYCKLLTDLALILLIFNGVAEIIATNLNI
jgi:hypothetical protein